MMLSVKLISAFVLISISCLGQEVKPGTSEWLNLKKQLQWRTDVVFNLTKTLANSKEVDKNELQKARDAATKLHKHTDSLQTIDSLSISVAYILHTALTQALSRVLVTLERDPEFKSTVAARDLVAQLEGAENRLLIARREYNKWCAETNRLDLLFGNRR
ncbi:MAG TPA: LemA family protein [Chitinophagaceae bacterium]|nr:LemA family protein [Chitinophagaceae bacterium]